jgi:pyruvate kinase
MVEKATRTVMEQELAGPADPVVVVAGIPFGQAGSTNNIRVVRADGN